MLAMLLCRLSLLVMLRFSSSLRSRLDPASAVEDLDRHKLPSRLAPAPRAAEAISATPL